MKKLSYSFIFLFILLCGCSKTGDIHGDVFITTKSGDVKKAAGNTIFIIKDDPGLLANISSIENNNKKEYTQLLDYDKALTDKHIKLTNDFSNNVYRTKDPDEGQLILAAWKNMDLDFDKKNQEIEKDMGAVWAHAKEETEAEILKYQIKQTSTDINAHYDIKGLPSGKYYIFSKFEFFDQTVYWFIPFEITNQNLTLNLSNANTGGTYWFK